MLPIKLVHAESAPVDTLPGHKRFFSPGSAFRQIPSRPRKIPTFARYLTRLQSTERMGFSMESLYILRACLILKGEVMRSIVIILVSLLAPVALFAQLEDK